MEETCRKGPDPSERKKTPKRFLTRSFLIFIGVILLSLAFFTLSSISIAKDGKSYFEISFWETACALSSSTAKSAGILAIATVTSLVAFKFFSGKIKALGKETLFAILISLLFAFFLTVALGLFVGALRIS